VLVSLVQEAWLSSLDVSCLRVACGVFFGSIQLHTRLSTTTPTLLSADRDSYGNMVYKVRFPGERYVYPNFDLSPFDVERELGASPYAMITLEYVRPSMSKSGQCVCTL
jgi:hypothetical protein